MRVSCAIYIEEIGGVQQRDGKRVGGRTSPPPPLPYPVCITCCIRISLQLPSDPRDEQCSPEPSPSSIIRSQRERPKRSSVSEDEETSIGRVKQSNLLDPLIFPFQNWPISVSHFMKFRMTEKKKPIFIGLGDLFFGMFKNQFEKNPFLWCF